MSVEYGIRVPTVGKPQETGAYARKVEAAGFDFMWTPDTPVLAGLWRDVYMHLTCAALETKKLRLGPGVTNPLTRHPVATASSMATLNEASDGRADLLVGTGYSSAYIIGRKAATLKTMRESMVLWRSIFSGAKTELGGLAIELDPSHPDLPIYMAASGPKALQLAGEVADGVLMMVGASTASVQWALDQVQIGMDKAGRNREDVRRILVVTTCVDADKERAIDQMRPCAAGLVRHPHFKSMFAEMGLEIGGPSPDAVWPYPDLGHAVDWEAAKAYSSFVPDAAVEMAVALGSGAEVAARVKSLVDLDIDAVWFRHEGTWDHPDDLLRGVSEEVLPLLR